MTRPDGKIQVVQDKQELERVMTKENENKCMLAHDSPPLNSPLVDILKPSGSSQATTDIVEGTFDPPSTVDDTSKMVQTNGENQPGKKSTHVPRKILPRNARKVGKK